MLKISNTYIPCDNVANPSAGLGSGLRCGRWFTKEEFLPEVQMGLWALGTVAILPRENREQGLLGSVPHSRANGLRAGFPKLPSSQHTTPALWLSGAPAPSPPARLPRKTSCRPGLCGAPAAPAGAAGGGQRISGVRPSVRPWEAGVTGGRGAHVESEP